MTDRQTEPKERFRECLEQFVARKGDWWLIDFPGREAKPTTIVCMALDPSAASGAAALFVTLAGLPQPFRFAHRPSEQFGEQQAASFTCLPMFNVPGKDPYTDPGDGSEPTGYQLCSMGMLEVPGTPGVLQAVPQIMMLFLVEGAVERNRRRAQQSAAQAQK